MFPLLQGTTPAHWDMTSWVALGIGAVATAFIFMRSRKVRKDPLERLERSPQQTTLAQERSMERQMQSLLIDLSDMSRQITAQLDTRSAKLELLIQDADERIRKLEALAVAQQALPAAPAPVTQSEKLQEEQLPDPRHADIYALADEGKNPIEIAMRLSRPSGEIELILALRTAPSRRDAMRGNFSQQTG